MTDDEGCDEITDKDVSKDEKIKDFCQRKALHRAKQVACFLERVALDESLTDIKKVRRKDKVSGETYYDDVEAPISMNVRVAAAKVWKEMFFDKAIGDVKEKAKDARKTGIDMKSALESLTKARLEARKTDPAAETDL